METTIIPSSQFQIRNTWYMVGFSEDFATEVLHQQTITERLVVLWRTREGNVVAFDDRCCHKRMPLSVGRFIDGGVLECAYHGLCFDSAGKCVRIPSQPGAPIPARARLRPFPLVEQDGVVWIWPGDPERIGDVSPPPVPELTDPAWTNTKAEQLVPANTVLMIENLLDVSHLYPLHIGNIGNIEHSAVPMRMESGRINGCEFVRTIREAENYRQTPDFVDMLGLEVIDGYNAQTVVGPGVILAERSVWPTGHRGDSSLQRVFKSMHFFTPISRKEHVYRWAFVMPVGQMSGNDPNKPGIQVMKEKVPPIVAQDVWAIEKQQEMFDLPDDGFEEMFLKTDAGITRARQILSAMQRAEDEHANVPLAASSAGIELVHSTR